MKKVSKTIWLEEAQLAQLRELSTKTRVPAAVYYREAIDLLLVKYATVLQAKRRRH